MAKFNPLSRTRALIIAYAQGKALKTEHPEIAAFYRTIYFYKKNLGMQLWTENAIAERFLPDIYARSQKVARTVVSIALSYLIPKDEREDLKHLYIQANGSITAIKNNPSQYRDRKKLIKLGRKRGISLAQSRGYILWTKEEKKLAIKLHSNPEYRNQRGCLESIASRLNEEFYDRRQVRSSKSVSDFFENMKRRPTLCSRS
jgi:hypothetical protein